MYVPSLALVVSAIVAFVFVFWLLDRTKVRQDFGDGMALQLFKIGCAAIVSVGAQFIVSMISFARVPGPGDLPSIGQIAWQPLSLALALLCAGWVTVLARALSPKSAEKHRWLGANKKFFLESSAGLNVCAILMLHMAAWLSEAEGVARSLLFGGGGVFLLTFLDFGFRFANHVFRKRNGGATS